MSCRHGYEGRHYTLPENAHWCDGPQAILICTCLLSEGTDVELPVTSLHNSWCEVYSGRLWLPVSRPQPH